MPKDQQEVRHSASSSLLADKCITALFVLLVFLGSFVFFTGSALAASTSALAPQIPDSGYCSNPALNGHCYAQTTWVGHASSSYTLINPYGALKCFGCTQYGFIDDETWFSDPNSSQCVNDAYHVCWVEAGVSTYAPSEPDNCNKGHDSTCGFWADSRPNGGGYHEHLLYNFGADGVDLTPYLIYITIYNATGNGSASSTWDVGTNIYKNGTWIAGPGGQSTSNNMNADDITIGSELADSNGSAGTFYFEDNEWRDGSGVFHYQTTTGDPKGTTDPPPHSYWEVNPCNCSGNTGGQYATYD